MPFLRYSIQSGKAAGDSGHAAGKPGAHRGIIHGKAVADGVPGQV